MKWILLLLIAVVLLFGVWLLTGPARNSSDDGSWLEIPAATAGKTAWVKAAQQFLAIDLRRVDPKDTVELLRRVVEHLGDEDWPEVQRAVFHGWEAVSGTEECRTLLAPIEALLIRRLVEFGSKDEFARMMDVADRNPNWKPVLEGALLRAVSQEVSASAPEKSRVLPILGAAVARRDWERASTYVSKVRFETGVPDALREQVVRLEEALRLFYDARGQAPFSMARVVSLWSTGPRDSLPSPVLLYIGIDLAKSGQSTMDFAKLRTAVADSKGESGAKGYWDEVMKSYEDSLPEQGAYLEAPSLEAISGAVAEGFGDKSLGVRFWKSVAAKATTGTIGEGMWKVECLKKAFHSSSDIRQKIGLLRDISAGYQKYMPGAARASVEQLASELPEQEKNAELASILADILAGAREANAKHDAARKRLSDEQAQMPTKTTLGLLQRQLVELKANNGNPEVIANTARQIRELEKKLTE